ncbi:hypothetical protein RGR602_PC00671 (plasmid) [Rhizobium gallicum bv. gallicum R602sp]|uniref:Uncharacterized protein n=1 Tax=Rhizobium gallicum bv. gallicum R602sp TaxID=1041138 RepID=A0A0B4X9N8_9HYPH|nr:hypothetical protein RGR602_PC00671 [Rhizobium gallicum bv. gallicum R602sp]
MRPFVAKRKFYWKKRSEGPPARSIKGGPSKHTEIVSEELVASPTIDTANWVLRFISTLKKPLEFNRSLCHLIDRFFHHGRS